LRPRLPKLGTLKFPYISFATREYLKITAGFTSSIQSAVSRDWPRQRLHSNDADSSLRVITLPIHVEDAWRDYF
jgi:hypothetical protein